jgi:NTE family protein
MENQAIQIGELKNKRIGVVFSSGFFGFFAHAGFLKAIEELGIEPVGYAGTSAGAIVAAFAAAGMQAQAIGDLLCNLRKEDFWDPEPWHKTALAALKLFKGSLGYLEGQRFQKLLKENLPVQTFEELPTPCVIVATNLTKKKKEVFTSGNLADAIQASSTIPWIFKLKQIEADLFLDGGLVDKAPLEELATRISPEVIIIHYIVSHDLKATNNEFLTRRLSPQKAYTLSMDIARHENYLSQLRLIRQQNLQVIEIRPSLPRITPDTLPLGRKAFAAAHHYALDYFKKL